MIRRLFLSNHTAMLFSVAAWFGIMDIHAQVRPQHFLPQAHAHNDYTRNNAFVEAYGLGFGSIEVDLFLQDGELYVAHERDEITADRTFDKLYLQPILQAYAASTDGYLYPNHGQLQLLIDAKTDGGEILKVLTEKLASNRALFDSKNNPKAVKLVVSGSKPAATAFAQYDDIFLFDGSYGVDYSADQLKRIGMVSAPFSQFSKWNGLGRLTDADHKRVTHAVDSVHRLQKPLRFWASPDTRTTWYEWLKLGIDYINTDKPTEVAHFLRTYDQVSHQQAEVHPVHVPKRQFALGQQPKNVVLLISDGAGLSQLWAAALANRGQLNVLNMPYTGYLMTGSTDNYHTDSAAGGSALATGVKTKNRHIGVDSTGRWVSNLPDVLAEHGVVSGIVSNDRVTGATPSSFYAHVRERDESDSIAHQLLDTKLSLVVGGAHARFADADSSLVCALRKKGFEVSHGVSSIAKSNSTRLIAFAADDVSRAWDKLDENQDEIHTDYRMIEEAFLPSVDFLTSRNQKKGFFLMVEGAKIDGGGHSNSMSFTVSEYLSFDKMVGQALARADQDGETLVIVTSDHETGGLVLLDGDAQNGKVLGHFGTTDHTGIPVPILSYGPGAEHFQGFIDNSELAKKLYQLLNIEPTKEHLH